MGGCCSKGGDMEGINEKCGNGGKIVYEVEDVEEEEGNVVIQEDGTRVRLQGYSKYISMFTQQGRKGINQDSMVVWEDFNGQKDVLFCGVFDGHGPSGHTVARHVRDVLPSKLLTKFKLKPHHISYNHSDADEDDYHDEDAEHDDCSSSTTKDSHDVDKNHDPLFSFWRTSLIDSFNDIDEELSRDSSINCYCSGTTAIAIVKQGEHLIIANLGDSRAILGTRDDKNQLVPDELTVDLKPNIPSEAERIRSSNGRVFAMEEEPGVYRVWLPDENTPGLAMSRAFGDFCLKSNGLISVPEVTYRKLSKKDEFVVLATDGVWDVLTNNEVIKIVASTKKRSVAAKLLVERAVQGWRLKYPGSKTDDVAVICLFIEHPPSSYKETIQDNASSYDDDLIVFHSASCSPISNPSGRECEPFHGKNSSESKENWSALEGNSRVNSIINLPRFLNWR